MILYVNGDSHSAGAEIISSYCFADDDPKYQNLGRKPHPDAVPYTYGYHLASKLNYHLYLDAESGSSNDRILRTTKEFIANFPNKNDLFVLIGWATWEREEWRYGDNFIQVTASGTDSVPKNMQERYKSWVVRQTEKELDNKTNLWHDAIWNFHIQLEQQGIKHLFFNTYLQLESNVKKDWGESYLDPYNMYSTYYYWLENNGYQTVNRNSYHYGADAHQAWAEKLLEHLTKSSMYNTI